MGIKAPGMTPETILVNAKTGESTEIDDGIDQVKIISDKAYRWAGYFSYWYGADGWTDSDQESYDETLNNAFEIQSLSMSFTGSAATFNDRLDRLGREMYFSEGTLELNATFNDENNICQTVTIMSISAKSGPWDFGPIPNGNYTANGIVNTRERGMVRNNVGFKVLLSDNVQLDRDGL
jgi:hypothetical protein